MSELTPNAAELAVIIAVSAAIFGLANLKPFGRFAAGININVANYFKKRADARNSCKPPQKTEDGGDSGIEPKDK